MENQLFLEQKENHFMKEQEYCEALEAGIVWSIELVDVYFFDNYVNMFSYLFLRTLTFQSSYEMCSITKSDVTLL